MAGIKPDNLTAAEIVTTHQIDETGPRSAMYDTKKEAMFATFSNNGHSLKSLHDITQEQAQSWDLK